MKTLYVHIGTPKTATTSLQLFFHENQEMLLEKGIAFPLMPHKYPEARIERNGHFLVGDIMLPNGEMDIDKKNELIRTGMDIIHKEFEKVDIVLLSDENLWASSTGYKIKFWNDLVEDGKNYGYQVKAIVYLRRQDELAASLFSQAIKTNYKDQAVRKWDYYKKNMTSKFLDYDVTLDKIANIIGKENIIVKVFERQYFSGNGNSIFSDFLEIIGLEYTDEFVIKKEAANPSITGNRQEIQRIINTILPDRYSMKILARTAALECEQLKDVDNNYSMFSGDEIKKIMKKYEAGNQKIAKEYLGIDGSLFHEDIKEQPVWTPDNPYMYEDIVRYFGIIVSRQQEEIENLKKLLGEIGNGDRSSEAVQKITSVNDLKVQLNRIHNEIFGFSKSDAVLRDEFRELKNQISSLKNENKNLKQKISTLEENSLLFRARRKLRHLVNEK